MSVPAAGAVIVVLWGALTLVLFRRRAEPLWVWTAAATSAGALAVVNHALVGLVPAAAAAVVIALPDGRLSTRTARISLAGALIACAPFAAIIAGADEPKPALLAIESCAAGLFALIAFALRCRRAGAADRARLLWAGWGAVVNAAVAIVVLLLHALVGWPDPIAVPIIVASAFVPIAIAFASIDRVARRIDRLLLRTIEAGGLVVLVGIVYLVVVLGFGNAPDDAQRRVLGLSIVAA